MLKWWGVGWPSLDPERIVRIQVRPKPKESEKTENPSLKWEWGFGQPDTL